MADYENPNVANEQDRWDSATTIDDDTTDSREQCSLVIHGGQNGELNAAQVHLKGEPSTDPQKHHVMTRIFI